MDDARVGALFVLCSGAGVGTLGVLGMAVGDMGLSIPTVLFLRFDLATVVVWTTLAARGELRRLQGQNLLVGVALVTGADPAAVVGGGLVSVGILVVPRR